MKAITLHQPWASLVAAGVKTIETRPRRTAYRGRIAIHAGLHRPIEGDECGDSGWYWEWDVDHGQITNWRTLATFPAPLGAVVASAVLTDCLPTADLRWTEISVGWASQTANGGIDRVRLPDDRRPVVAHVDQQPFGDFQPGRWALLLDDIAPTTERCPACWDSDLEPGIVPCVLHRGQPMDEACFACWNGEPCPTCDGATRCDPVPARGQQAVPWEWTP